LFHFDNIKNGNEESFAHLLREKYFLQKKLQSSLVFQTISEAAEQRPVRYTGSNTSFTYRSLTTQVQLRFTSDGSVTRRGFTAKFYGLEGRL